eukprot:CAMPEP_0196663688 /NCGR_PEP_ID=MMETSP1086-20130531/53835_1 /TAXON_ID=77921 /ORGANISM="Cyanoptyche  gloeocystis , Strain SAG4.97" /LENGTH=45 /DNA_ID= /DNA_START= /DNA_END= /DNA_ORIENTATION=
MTLQPPAQPRSPEHWRLPVIVRSTGCRPGPVASALEPFRLRLFGV